MYVHMQLIHFVVQKKLIENCKIIILQLKKNYCGTFLQVQWLGLRASTAGGIGSALGQGTKILHATRPKKKKRERMYQQVIQDSAT